VEATKRKLEDMEDEVKTLKRRHANSIKVVITVIDFVYFVFCVFCLLYEVTKLPRTG